jgi:hypothetical protein
MLYFAIIWTLLLLVCSVIGTGVLHWSRVGAFVRLGDRLITSQWLGIIILAISLLVVSLIAPVSLPIGILVAGGLCGLALSLQPVRLELATQFQQITGPIILGYSTVVIALAALLTRPVSWLDTGLYHYSTIQWLSQYGTVTGVALIFNNLGFVSAWFALAAPLNPAFLDARGTAVMGGFVLLLAVLHWLICLLQFLYDKGQASDRFGLAFLSLLLPIVLFFRLFSQILVSPSPDVPMTFLIGIVPWAMLVVDNAPTNRSTRSTVSTPASVIAAGTSLGASAGTSGELPPRSQTTDAAIVPLILAVGAVTIKLTTLPLLALSSLFYFVRNFRSSRQLVLGAAIVSLLLAPMLLAGIKTSGCPLYPSSVFCLDLPWLPSPQKINEVEKGTHGWTTWFGSPPPDELPWLWLLKKWLQSERTNLGIALLLLLSFLTLGVYPKPLIKSSTRGKYWVLATGILGFSFLMTTAPFFRFALPYLLLPLSLAIIVWQEQIFPQTVSKSTSTTSKSQSPSQYFFVPDSIQTSNPLGLPRVSRRTIVSAGLAIISVALAIFLQRNAISYVFLPPPMRSTAFIEKQVNDITYFSPEVEGEVCWDAPLPCGFIIESDVRLRDPDRGIASGFIREQTVGIEDN